MSREISVLVVDGYIDDPAALGVPPYISPMVRSIAGAALDAGADMGPSVGGMLFKAVYTRSLNCLRHRNVAASRVALIEDIVLQQADARDPHYASSPQANAENADLRRRIDEAIERLPQRCRDVFRLSYMQDLSNSKIASVLGLSVRTVESHIYHALNTLRSILYKD